MTPVHTWHSDFLHVRGYKFEAFLLFTWTVEEVYRALARDQGVQKVLGLNTYSLCLKPAQEAYNSLVMICYAFVSL